jgi:hypothetical protein
VVKTFEFANPHGKIGSLILEPGKPPVYWWAGRGDCPEPVREAMTRGLSDPETGEQVGGDRGEHFLEVLAVEYGKGRFLAGRRGPEVRELPPRARKITYTPGISSWWKG